MALYRKSALSSLKSGEFLYFLTKSLLVVVMVVTTGNALDNDSCVTTAPAHEAIEWSAVTLTALGGLMLDKSSVWSDKPLIGGSGNAPYKTNTVPDTWIIGGSVGFALGIALIPNRSGWLNTTAYTNAKGMLEASTINLLLCHFVKVVVGRKRPSYNNFPENEQIAARKSFYSAHAAGSFSAATYSSLYIFEHIGSNDNSLHVAGKIIYAAATHSLASYIAYTRVEDNRHFVSDVVVGAVTGSMVSTLVYVVKNRLHNKKGKE